MVKVWDGVEVFVFMVYCKGFKKDGIQLLLFYGYGFYGNSMEFYFSLVCFSLFDWGFVYVIVYIWGGEEMGCYWYEDGKLFNKKNIFIDFIDVVDYFVVENYISKEQLFVMGGSVGGLLMGVVINMCFDFWKGVIVVVFFVDVVIMMFDEFILLMIGEFDEWGNLKDKIYYEYIKFYLFYDNVEVKEYLVMMVMIGLYDFQV